MDFFLWGYVKNQVYATPSQSPADLKARIIAACAAITPQTLNRVHNATLRRIKTCVEQDGQLFEHLLLNKTICVVSLPFFFSFLFIFCLFA